MAVTNADNRRTLAALTTAALSLPGLQADAATPGAEPQLNLHYGHYQESNNRMQVDVYHADFTVPYKERLELSFSIDRDTYSGATPAFSLPKTMTNQSRYEDGVLNSNVDIVSAASQGVTAGGLTILGGLNTFADFRAIYDPAKADIDLSIESQKSAQFNAAINQFKLDNPQPPGATTTTVTENVTINFEGMTQGSYSGEANTAASGACADCYVESGFVLGVVDDGNPTNHLHSDASGSGIRLAYHNDSTGIYLRALDGSAFRVLSLDWDNIDPGNPKSGVWEILGFNAPSNPSLSTGDGTNYATRNAYQTVTQTNSAPNLRFDGSLALDGTFSAASGINALWIHFKGTTSAGNPIAGTSAPGFLTSTEAANLGASQFLVNVDNIRIAYDKLVSSGSPAAIAWQAALNNFEAGKTAELNASFSALQTELTKQLTIQAYAAVLNRMTPPMTTIVQKFQEQPIETRTMPTFSGKYYFDDYTLAFSGGKSEEPDFVSNFGSINVSHEFNNKLTTVSLGYNTSSNQISRSTDNQHAASSGHAHGGSDSPGYSRLDENSNYHGFNIGLSQVITKNTLIQSTLSYTNQNGYLSNPYKFVYVRGEVTPEEYYQIQMASSGNPFNWNSITNLEMVGIDLFREVRPDQRNQWSLSNRINQHIPALDASLHFDYRYYRDDWGVNSHTFEFAWYQSLPMGFTITPSMRYYSQSQAEFFAPYFLAPRADDHYSSDFRLADFGALSGGISFSKQLSKGIKLDAGFEYYTRQSGLKLGGGEDNSYADYSYYLVHAGLNVNLGAPRSQHSEHQNMHHHGAPLPAGVMYGHMMNAPGEFMVGYRYMYANQTGDIRHGDHAMEDASLLHLACGSNECASRPTEMSMNMHMLDLMYAPTDWLNLMLMPQIMDMKMSLAEVPGTTVENEHGSGHSSGALGDTIMAAMIKVFDMPGHHVHLSLGVSAPTGDNEVTVDGQDSMTSELQDYGMQIGSGTWDFRPSLTYTGQSEEWSWGAQLGGIKRMQNRNRVGYALGDVFQSTAWGSYQVLNWLSTSIRGIYSEQGRIQGEFNRAHSTTSTVDYASNYGGRFWDVGFGLNATIPEGPLTGHQVSVEWLQPVADNYNGYQLEREGSLNATWTFAF
ncbi:DUF3570 domain-containing protein [Methylomonas rosea]|uniref:DUF3570 domain-containing protein n=1 Tax=Methylomonas rosea TaxID=2952227 RepID=A0ABT1TR96_9GAMM|nr:DUF3570 domain-containing protein [Methylomonas sp. WSC-7]